MGSVRGLRSNDPTEQDAAGAVAPVDFRSRALRVFTTNHLAAVLVLLLVSGVTVATTLALRGVVRSQEKRLLDERATELVAYLTSATTQASATLSAAGQAAWTPPSRLFPFSARPSPA